MQTGMSATALLRRPVACAAAIAISLAVANMSGCAHRNQDRSEPAADHRPKLEARTHPFRPAAINHLAFFKLKDPAQAEALIADCDAYLATIPGVESYFCGRHFDAGRGDRIDSNYDVGFFVGFADAQAYARYVEHPEHRRLIEKWQPQWEWIRVQDVLDETP